MLREWPRLRAWLNEAVGVAKARRFCSIWRSIASSVSFASANVSMTENGSPISLSVVSRNDNGYGDKNLICTCPPLEAYAEGDEETGLNTAVFDVITNGLGLMPAYGYPIPVEDRWAIVSHVRDLQAEFDDKLGQPIKVYTRARIETVLGSRYPIAFEDLLLQLMDIRLDHVHNPKHLVRGNLLLPINQY